jgi:hypothetical protein
MVHPLAFVRSNRQSDKKEMSKLSGSNFRNPEILQQSA